MGCFVDVVWYDLNATPERRPMESPGYTNGCILVYIFFGNWFGLNIDETWEFAVVNDYTAFSVEKAYLSPNSTVEEVHFLLKLQGAFLEC